MTAFYRIPIDSEYGVSREQCLIVERYGRLSPEPLGENLHRVLMSVCAGDGRETVDLVSFFRCVLICRRFGVTGDVDIS